MLLTCFCVTSEENKGEICFCDVTSVDLFSIQTLALCPRSDPMLILPRWKLKAESFISLILTDSVVSGPEQTPPLPRRFSCGVQDQQL